MAFGLGYLLVVVVHTGLYAEAYGTAVLRFVPLNIAGALSVIAAGFVGGPAAYVLWLVPIVLQYVTSTFVTQGVRSATRLGFDIRAAHFVERHGLLLIVAFGESVVAIGIGIGGRALDGETIGAGVLGLALASALWWTYFDEDADRAAAALVAAPAAEFIRMSLHACFYAYILMLLGIVMAAAGVALAIDEIGAPVELGPAVLLGGGVALYLSGTAAFRAALLDPTARLPDRSGRRGYGLAGTGPRGRRGSTYRPRRSTRRDARVRGSTSCHSRTGCEFHVGGVAKQILES